MKLYRRDFRIFKDFIFIFPTIILALNDPIYSKQNIAIEFRWLVFHARLLWMRGDADAVN